jgi:hypothetical protein
MKAASACRRDKQARNYWFHIDSTSIVFCLPSMRSARMNEIKKAARIDCGYDRAAYIRRHISYIVSGLLTDPVPR